MDVSLLDSIFSLPFSTLIGAFIFFGLLTTLLIWLFTSMETFEQRRYEHRWATGEAAEALVLSVRDTGWRLQGKPLIRYELEVRRPGIAPYRATAHLRIPRAWSSLPYGQDSLVPVRIDPANPQKVVMGEPWRVHS